MVLLKLVGGKLLLVRLLLVHGPAGDHFLDRAAHELLIVASLVVKVRRCRSHRR